MRRLLALTLVLACAAALVLLGTGAGDDDSGTYEVRTIFRNAFSLVPGEDVKIAGVRVGQITELDVTADQMAAVVIEITEPGFDDFRTDAECSIRPQSLIGEKFVECVPTQPRPAGQQPPPALPEIPDGEPGAGQHLLPVEQTSRPVDIDLVNNIMRLPYRQRLGIIINEFGTGLAARGEDLNEVIRNADPALKATDKVLKLLASQEKVLADLAEESRTSLAPLARDPQVVKDFVEYSANLATATAEVQGPFGEQFEKLPAFLRELRPTMQRLGSFADEATPVLSGLGAVAPEVSRLIEASGPFAESSTKSLVSLGKATIPGRRALVAAEGIVDDLGAFATSAKPLAKGLADLTTSFRDTGGIERLLDYLFYQVAAINGYDAFGHYLRAGLILNLCTTYATTANDSPVCKSNFQAPISRAAGRDELTAEQALNMPGVDLATRRSAAILRGMSAAEAIRLTAGQEDGSTDPVTPESIVAQSEAQAAPPATTRQTAGGSGSGSGGGAGNGSQQVLDYLLGGAE